MTITRYNLKIFKPEQLGSNDEAGGQRTRNVVQSGKLNELFPAISDIDHAQSAIDFAKCYPALDTQDTSTLLDAHTFISRAPNDPLVSLMLVESDKLNDADRLPEMKEILESSVTAGQLLREGLAGFVAGQDSFSRSFLQTVYSFNNRDYYNNVRLEKGAIIAISVEYSGNEDGEYPRFTHYAQLTSDNNVGARDGSVTFTPPVPFKTPDADVTINGDDRCTKLRYVNSQPDKLKFHGVSKLTEKASGKVLKVKNTKGDLLPAVNTVSESTDNAITLENENGDTSYVTRRTIKQATNNSSTYIFNIDDLLTSEIEVGVSLAPQVKGYLRPTIRLSGSSVVVTYSSPPPEGFISLEYVSSSRYSVYQKDGNFPANKKITRGTIKAKFGTQNLLERDGKLYSFDNLRQVERATINYETGEISNSAIEWLALIENKTVQTENSVEFALSVRNPILDTFYVRVSTTADVLLSASANAAGVITGTNVNGTIENGLVSLTFGAAVDLTTLRYDISESVRLLPPAELYGLNPLRIPNGGQVPIFAAWETVSIQHSQNQVVSNPQVNQELTIRDGARFVDITDSTGKSLWTVDNQHFQVDLDNNKVIIKSTFADFTAPFVLTDTLGELALVTQVGSNTLTLASNLSREYPANSDVSSVQVIGDLQARVGKVRDMTAWNNNWDKDGAPATANLNVVSFPIEVDNETAVNEEWVLIFTSATAFRCVGERIGQVATGDTVNDFAPVNPLTNKPFFIIRKGAFGGGWNAGEAVRFNTVASAQPIMALRTTQAGHSQVDDDKAIIAFRGNES
ncbi:hypothetical protein D5018_03975 [Parashewanella curva]|uniref:Uncharacterized protein n=1 Tax=Parashewanella curva TaxID=2338552 RepID=A0A3L8Q015_9GAMM|nr:hypothetical protein [Parashewanella curva]RLV61007.1 hypothetical protein D5018_03975 [Parashewanella curva]